MKRALQLMQAEFESTRLEVGLIPCRKTANEGGMIRVAFSKNCEWYRKLCLAYPSGRKRVNSAPDTRIKRRNIASVLARLASNKTSRSRYVPDILRYAGAFRGKGNGGGFAKGGVAKGKRANRALHTAKARPVSDWPF